MVKTTGKILAVPDTFLTVEATPEQVDHLIKASAGITFSIGNSQNGLLHLIEGQWVVSLCKREGGEAEKER